MKKVLMFSGLTLIGIIALSSCRKDYECVLSDGTVYDTCNDCKSSGVEKSLFDSSCAVVGGTVQVK